MQARCLPRAALVMRFQGAAFLFALFACLVLSARAARADEQVPVLLDYAAPPVCPAANRFLAEVAARTSMTRPAQPNERAIKLRVVIKEVAGGDKGTLQFESIDGLTSVRQVSAADCEQVVSALALMTALAIDPNASTEPVPKSAPPPPKPAVPPPDVTTPRAQVREALPPKGTSTRWRLQLGTALEALSGVAPNPLWLLRPSAELGTSSGSRWSAAFRLSGAFAHTAVSEPDGAAEYTLLSGRLEGCPRLRAWRGFELAPCLAVDAGRLQVAGVGLAPSNSVTPVWLAPGFVGRLAWEIVGVLVVEVSGEVLFPLVRDRFYVNADTTLYRTPPVSLGATAGLGVRFP